MGMNPVLFSVAFEYTNAVSTIESSTLPLPLNTNPHSPADLREGGTIAGNCSIRQLSRKQRLITQRNP
jgi:hypothetical protein